MGAAQAYDEASKPSLPFRVTMSIGKLPEAVPDDDRAQEKPIRVNYQMAHGFRLLIEMAAAHADDDSTDDNENHGASGL